MINTWFKIFLYISSYIPLAAMIYLKSMRSLSISSLVSVYRSNEFFWIILLGFLIIASLALLFWLRSMKNEAASKGKKYKLGQLKSNDGEVMNYFISYIIPIVSLDITSEPSILMNLTLIIVIGIFFVRNNNLHYNVLLIVLGFHVYSDDIDNVIISRKKLHEINNKSLKADQIGTSNIFYI